MEYSLMEVFLNRQALVLKNAEANQPNETILPVFVSIKSQSTCALNNSLLRKQDDKVLLYAEQENQPDFLYSNILNQFLLTDNLYWDMLEIIGVKGIKKKTLARQFEAYVWKQSKGNEIPILVQICECGGLQDKNLDQILKQKPYSFDFDYIEELKSQVNNKKLKLILIINSCKSQEEQQEFKKFHFNLCEEWKNCKIIRFVDSIIETFIEANSLTVEIDYFSDNEIKQIFSLSCNKNLYQCLIKLYLDLNLDQKNLENFSQKIKDLILQIKEKSSLEIVSMIDETFNYITSTSNNLDHEQITNCRLIIDQLLNYDATIQKLNKFGLADFLRIPYSLSIILKIYPKLSNMKLSTRFHFLKCFLKHFLFQEYLDLNQLNEKNLDPYFKYEIFKLNCQRILENLKSSPLEIQGLQTLSIFLQQNEKFHSLTQQFAFLEYLFEIINTVKIKLISNVGIPMDEIAEEILNYLIYHQSTQILRCSDLTQIIINFDTHIFHEVFKNHQKILQTICEEDTWMNNQNYLQTITFIYVLMSGIRSQAQASLNLKHLLLTIYVEDYQNLPQSADNYNIIAILPSKQIQNVAVKMSINSEFFLKKSSQNNNRFSICFTHPYLLGFPKEDIKIQYSEFQFSEQKIKIQKIKQSKNLYVTSTLRTAKACTPFGPFLAILSSSQTIILFNIKNSKIIRRLQIPIEYFPEALSLTLSQDSEYLAGSSDTKIFLCKLQSKNLLTQQFQYESVHRILEIRFLAGTKILVLLNNFEFNIFDLRNQIAIIRPDTIFQGQIVNRSSIADSIKLLSYRGMVFMQMNSTQTLYFICSEDIEWSSRNSEIGQQNNIFKINRILQNADLLQCLRLILIRSRQGLQINQI